MTAAPSIAEAVVAGQDREDVRLLVWASPTARAEFESGGLSGEALEAALRARIAGELRVYNEQNTGAARRIGAFAILRDPPSLGGGRGHRQGQNKSARCAYESGRTGDRALFFRRVQTRLSAIEADGILMTKIAEDVCGQEFDQRAGV